MGCMYPLSSFSTKQSDVLAFSVREGGEGGGLFLLFRFKKSLKPFREGSGLSLMMSLFLSPQNSRSRALLS